MFRPRRAFLAVRVASLSFMFCGYSSHPSGALLSSDTLKPLIGGVRSGALVTSMACAPVWFQSPAHYKTSMIVFFESK